MRISILEALTEKKETFLVLWQAEVAIPSWHKHHIISQVFPLDFGLLHNHNIRLENIEHGLEVSG
jgi:hypothetical protein